MDALYGDTVADSLQKAGFTVLRYVFPAGEASKNILTLSGLLEFLAANHVTRTDCIAALGGGVCGDLAGFAAAVYLRGIRYIQLPTTLLAAVDSSVGGKTAVDLAAGKKPRGRVPPALARYLRLRRIFHIARVHTARRTGRVRQIRGHRRRGAVQTVF